VESEQSLGYWRILSNFQLLKHTLWQRCWHLHALHMAYVRWFVNKKKWVVEPVNLFPWNCDVWFHVQVGLVLLLRCHAACHTAQVHCQSHVALRWVIACLLWHQSQRGSRSSVCQSLSSATSVVVSLRMLRCRYMSLSVYRSGMCRIISCRGLRDDHHHRNLKFLHTLIRWPGRQSYVLSSYADCATYNSFVTYYKS